MSRDDHVDSFGDGIDAKRLEIMEDVDSSRCDPHETRRRHSLALSHRAHVAPNCRDRRDPTKRDQHFRPSDVAAVNDVVDACQMPFRFRPQQTVGIEMIPILSVFMRWSALATAYFFASRQ